MSEPFVAWPSEREGYATPGRGDVTWFTLVSGERSPSEALSAGIAEFPSGGAGLAPHRHAEAEIYHVLAGEGVVTIDGVAHPVRVGATVFIPGDAEHGVRNGGPETLRIFYVFPTDRFPDVVYRFSHEAKGADWKARRPLGPLPLYGGGLGRGWPPLRAFRLWRPPPP